MGVGVSLGDEYYPQPYVYISPSARFEAAELPDPPFPGHWHTEGFFGVVATGDDILAMRDRGQGLRGFIAKAFEIGRARVSA